MLKGRRNPPFFLSCTERAMHPRQSPRHFCRLPIFILIAQRLKPWAEFCATRGVRKASIFIIEFISQYGKSRLKAARSSVPGQEAQLPPVFSLPSSVRRTAPSNLQFPILYLILSFPVFRPRSECFASYLLKDYFMILFGY